MRYIHVNLDFEYELNSPPASDRPKAPGPHEARRLAWAHILRLAPGWSDAQVLDAEGQPRLALGADQLCAWGWTPTSRARLSPAAQLALPSHEAVLWANDKRTSARHELMLCPQLRGHALLTSLEHARAWVECQSCPWVIKHPLGVSGRERLLGRSSTLSQADERWIQRQLERCRPLRDEPPALVAEPWVTRHHERSTQLELEPCGRWRLVGAVELLTDATGTLRGHLVSPAHARPEPLQTSSQLGALMSALHAGGYWGPVGLDALEGVHPLDGHPVRRPILEINARWTFGRLALELGRQLAPTLWLGWWHPSAKEVAAQGATASRALPELTPGQLTAGLYRLPEALDPGSLTHARLALGHTRQEVHALLTTS